MLGLGSCLLQVVLVWDVVSLFLRELLVCVCGCAVVVLYVVFLCVCDRLDCFDAWFGFMSAAGGSGVGCCAPLFSL